MYHRTTEEALAPRNHVAYSTTAPLIDAPVNSLIPLSHGTFQDTQAQAHDVFALDMHTLSATTIS